MVKWIGLTSLVSAFAVMTLGCARGLTVPAAAGGALWRDISIYRASSPLRLAGPIYEVISYETKAGCEAAQRAAMAKEALSRVGPMTERLSDGIKTWESDHQHYTTFRYLCRLAGAGHGALPVDSPGGNSRHS